MSETYSFNDIPKLPIHQVFDASKISEYEGCPRKFFFRYVLGWQFKASNIHLEFGTAWHLAKEYLLSHGVNNNNLAEAYNLFEEHYRMHFGPETDGMYAPKDPGNAMYALIEYVNSHHEAYRDIDVLHTEVAAHVMIAKDRLVCGKIDAICRDERGVFGVDHKTTQRDTAVFQEGFKLTTQFSLYTHILYSYYSPEEVWGYIIEGAILRKKGNLHCIIPILKQPGMMNAWLGQINRRIDDMQRDYDRLEDIKPDDLEMGCFDPNPKNCTSYMKMCEFHSCCTSWQNPVANFYRVPGNMEVKHWDPMAEAKDGAKAVTTPDGIKEVNVDES